MVLCFRLFCFKDQQKGEIKFAGNILFTHFNEIGEPNKNLDHIPENSYKPPPTMPHGGAMQELNINTVKL